MKYGDVATIDDKKVFLGTVRIKDLWKYRKYRKVRWWLGTDAFTLYMFPPGKSYLKVLLHRIKVILVNKYFEENWFVSQRLINELPDYYKSILNCVSVKVHEAEYIKRIKKPFVVGYYMPELTEFNSWVYGVDIIAALYVFFKYSELDIVFLRYDGKADMSAFLSLIDVYIRPSRHDGMPRLILLCEMHDIPYCWNTDFDLLVKFIKEHRK